MDLHELRAGVLVAQYDVDEAVNKAADAQLETETAHERAEKAERTANEVRQSNRDLLERLRNMERQVLEHAQRSLFLLKNKWGNRGRCHQRVEHGTKGDQLKKLKIRGTDPWSAVERHYFSRPT